MQVDTHVMKDNYLAFPLVTGLDFLSATGAVLDFGDGRYGLKQKKVTHLQKRSRLTPTPLPHQTFILPYHQP